MTTISFEIKCEDESEARELAENVTYGNHQLGRVGDSWTWHCTVPVADMGALGREMEYILGC